MDIHPSRVAAKAAIIAYRDSLLALPTPLLRKKKLDIPAVRYAYYTHTVTGYYRCEYYILVVNDTTLLIKSNILSSVRLAKGKLYCEKSQATTTGFSLLVRFKQFEFLQGLIHTPHFIVERFFQNKVVLKKLISGKITSERDFLLNVIKINNLKNISVRNLKLMVSNSLPITSSGIWNCLTTKDLIRSISNINVFIDKAITLNAEGERDSLIYMADCVELCATFGLEFNPNWSAKRIKAEHDALNKTLSDLTTEFEFSDKESLPIYTCTPQLRPATNIAAKILDSEIEIFRVSKELSFCLHSNYFQRIKAGVYFAVLYTVSSNSGSNSFVVGIEKRYNGLSIDQVKGVRNQNPTQVESELINSHVVDVAMPAIEDLIIDKSIEAFTKAAPVFDNVFNNGDIDLPF